VLVLDFDGTVVDTEWPSYRSWAEIWEGHGEELTVAAWQVRIGTHHGHDALAELEERLGRRLDPALRDARQARKDELTAATGLNPGVLGWLDEAARLGVPVGIASSSSSSWVASHLERLGLRGRVAFLACCDGDLPPKPDPASFRTAVQRLGGDPAESVAVEDSGHGVDAAVAAGLWTVAVPHRLTEGLDLSRAHRIVRSLEELTLAEALDAARARPDQPRRRASS
jgi:putative hydrolase of the HAD superfamily